MSSSSSTLTLTLILTLTVCEPCPGPWAVDPFALSFSLSLSFRLEECIMTSPHIPSHPILSLISSYPGPSLSPCCVCVKDKVSASIHSHPQSVHHPQSSPFPPSLPPWAVL
ncbi:MAG: hypothetical protein J3Q66DRAFT_361531, partial [Benniella sp.]